MAKDISLLGATYPDVPAVTLPMSPSGTATFVDPDEYGNIGRIWYATCSTAAATRDKAVSITGVTAYENGDIFIITFENAQDYNGGPRLNVNGLGVKNIRRLTGSNAARYQWQAGETLILVYNGTYMLAVNNGLAGTTYYGLTKLISSCTSTSSGLAVSASGLNAYSERMIAGVPLYDAEATYEVGDRVRYSWYIYECNTPITTAEAWNADHWTQLPALQEQIDNIFGMTVAQIKAM